MILSSPVPLADFVCSGSRGPLRLGQAQPALA